MCLVNGVTSVKYFSDLFHSSSPSEFDSFLDEVPQLATEAHNIRQTALVSAEAHNIRLTALVSEEEVRTALFMIHSKKALGSDGMTALFYQQSWSVIKIDVINLVHDFLSSGFFDDRLNMKNIYLIPKTVRPNRMMELRSISLCNVGYKIISKVLCQRLKSLLPHLIT